MTTDLKNSKRKKTSTLTTAPRQVPQAVGAEQGVLGCMLLAPKEGVSTFTEFAPMGTELFYDLRHQTICDALLRLVEKHGGADTVTLSQLMKDEGTLEDVGGVLYLSTLQDVAPSAANITYHLELVKEKYLLRQTLEVCEALSQKIYNYDGRSDELLDRAERDILAIRQHQVSSDISLKQVVGEALVQIEDSIARNDITGLSTGLPDLDQTTDGLHKGEMTVIGGYPGRGKTSLAMNLAEHVVMKLGLSAGVFTLEMNAVELVKRCICSHARVNLRTLHHGYLESSAPKLIKSAGKMMKARLWLDDTGDLSVFQLRAKARRWHHQNNLDLLVVDYLQLLSARGGADRMDSRQEEVACISRNLKALAKELKIPVVVLSQLNDDGNLRESRAIGQDADNVWQLRKDKDAGENPDAVPVHLYMEKQRNGPRGVNVPLTFLAALTRFESRAREDEPESPNRKPYSND